MIYKLAVEAGTSSRVITFETTDKRPVRADGVEVFLKRTISACIKGRPDLLIKKTSGL
jgi:hypothetical protein